MKLILPLFAMILAALGADGQTCERTIPVGLAVPGTNGADFEATLNRRLLTVVKVEPFHHSRILVLIQADFSHLKAHDKDFRRVVDWLAAIDRIPENAALAYGLYSEKIAFSNRFTSDPQELRSDLNELVAKARSGAIGQRDYGHRLLRQALQFFGQPRPGDAVVLVAEGEGESDEVEFQGPIDLTTEGAFLTRGVRLFVMDSYYRPERNIPFMYTAEGSGGHIGYLGNAQISRQEEEANRQSQRDFLLNGLSDGSLLTVAVPEGIRAKRGDWSLRLSDAALSRSGVTRSRLWFQYGDLPLCDTTAKGNLKIAAADRQKSGAGR